MWAMPFRTLLELAHTRWSILVVCHRCRHEGLVYPVNVGPRFGWEMTVADLPRRLRCSDCGGRDVTVYEATR
jgi:hypothetical protein